MRDSELVKALGGPTAVAAAVGLTVQAVGNWVMRDSIPPERRLAVWRLAVAKGIDWAPPEAGGYRLLAPDRDGPGEAA